jgi:hypothetical protein
MVETQGKGKSILELQQYLVHLVLKSSLGEESNRATLYIWAKNAEEAGQKAKELLKRGTILRFDDNAWDIEWVEVKNRKL